MKTEVKLHIPAAWAEEGSRIQLTTPEDRMRKVIEWGFANVEQGGGPFSAGVFDLASGQCLSVGLNRVVDTHCSVAHAEMMALMLAQQAVGSHDLSTYGPVVLTTSAQPCSQCFGALPWAGIQAMEFGAGREEVEAIGFDEGPCPDNWRKALESRGIAVQGPLLASEALRLLQTYQQRGGQLY